MRQNIGQGEGIVNIGGISVLSVKQNDSCIDVWDDMRAYSL